MKKKLDHVQGLERAKLLDEIVMDYDQLCAENDDVAKYSAQIIALDPENKAGLKLKYTFRGLMAEADAMSGEKKFDAARVAYEKAANFARHQGTGASRTHGLPKRNVASMHRVSPRSDVFEQSSLRPLQKALRWRISRRRPSDTPHWPKPSKQSPI